MKTIITKTIIILVFVATLANQIHVVTNRPIQNSHHSKPQVYRRYQKSPYKQTTQQSKPIKQAKLGQSKQIKKKYSNDGYLQQKSLRKKGYGDYKYIKANQQSSSTGGFVTETDGEEEKKETYKEMLQRIFKLHGDGKKIHLENIELELLDEDHPEYAQAQHTIYRSHYPNRLYGNYKRLQKKQRK